MQERIITLVSGNASWWKSRKYRKESAKKLRALKREGWRLTRLERLLVVGVDTRRRTAYHLRRKTDAATRQSG